MDEGRLFEHYSVDYDNQGKEGGVYVASNGDMYFGRGGAVLRMARGSRELETYAGRVSPTGYVDGHRLSIARFSAVGGMCPIGKFGGSNSLSHSGGSGLLVCDRSNHNIRMVERDQVSTFAGRGRNKGFKDGPRLESDWSWPNDIIFHQDSFYVTDYGNNRIRIISSDGMVTSIGNGKEISKDGDIGSGAVSFKCPFDLCIIRDCIYVTDQLSHSIRRINLTKGSVKTIAGISKESGFADGSLKAAAFHYPKGLDATSNGDLVVADYANLAIRLVSLSDKTVKTLVWGKKKPSYGNNHSSVASSNDSSAASSSDSSSTFGPLSSFENNSEPYFLAVSPYGDLVWNPNSNRIRVIKELFPPSSESSIRASQMRFSDLLHIPDLCDITLTFEHPIHPTILPLRLRLPNHFSNARNTDDVPYSASNSSQTIHFASELLNCIHPSIGNNSEFWKTLAHSKVPGRIVDFICMLMDFHFLNNDSFTAIAVYLLELAGLKQDSSPVLNWALTAFSSSISLIKDIPTLLEILEDVSMNLESNNSLILKILRHASRIHVTEFLLEKMDSSAFLSSDMKENIHKIYQLEINDVSTPSERNNEMLRLPDAMAQGVSKLASQLVFEDSPSLPSLNQNDSILEAEGSKASRLEKENGLSFCIGIEGRTEHFKVHEWVLRMRWPYFTNVMASGLSESVEKKIELPSDFPPALLLCALQFMYCRHVLTPITDEDDIVYLISNGAQFGFLELDGSSTPEFNNFAYACSSQIILPLTPSNCLEQLSIRTRIGNREWTDDAIAFIGRNISKIVTSDTERSLILTFPTEIVTSIFDQSLRACYK